MLHVVTVAEYKSYLQRDVEALDIHGLGIQHVLHHPLVRADPLTLRLREQSVKTSYGEVITETHDSGEGGEAIRSPGGVADAARLYLTQLQRQQ